MKVRSISNKWHDIADEVSNRGASVIALIETWCTSDTMSRYNIHSFVAFHLYRCSKRGGGVDCYLKKNYKPYLLDVPNYAGPLDELAVQ